MKAREPLFSLVLPAFNPGSVALRSAEAIIAFVHSHEFSWEVIFVCDGCTDGSDQRLAARVRDLPNFRVMRYARNRGKGYAVRLGLLAARGHFRLFTDIDLAYRLDMVDRVARQLLEGHPIVIASRAHAASECVAGDGLKTYLRRRRVQSLAFTSAARTILGLHYPDTQAGLKGFSAAAVKRIVPHTKCPGFGFDCELLVGARHFGIPVREIPVRVHYDGAASTTSSSSGLRIIRELVGIRRHWEKFRRYGKTGAVGASISAAQIAALRQRCQRDPASAAPLPATA